MAGYTQSVEIKSYAEEARYVLIISGAARSLLVLAPHIPLRKDLDLMGVIKTAQTGYMPQQYYDELGSNIRNFANNYVRLMHITKRSYSEETLVFSREQLSDIMLSQGWTLIGFSSHPGPTVTGMAICERWMK